MFILLDKSLYDVRASEQYHGGTEPLMRVSIMEKIAIFMLIHLVFVILQFVEDIVNDCCVIFYAI